MGLHCQARCNYHPCRQCSLYGLNLQLDKEVEAVTHALVWIASKGDSRTKHAIILTDSVSLIQKVKARLECVSGRRPPSKTPLSVLPWTSRNEREYRADRLAGNATLTSGLLLGRSEVLRSLRHYLRAQSQGRHTINRLEERIVERGSARQSSLKGRERAIVNQTDIATVSKATLRKLLREGMEDIWAFPSA